VKDSFADVSRKGERLGRGGRVGGGVVPWGDWLGVEFVDVGDVIGANGRNGLGGTGQANGLAVLIVVGCELGVPVGTNVRRACILRKTSDLHGRVEEESNIAGEGRVDAVANSVVDGGIRALLLSRRRKDEHVEVEEEPPKWCRIVNGSAVSIGSDDGPYDGSLEVAES